MSKKIHSVYIQQVPILQISHLTTFDESVSHRHRGLRWEFCLIEISRRKAVFILSGGQQWNLGSEFFRRFDENIIYTILDYINYVCVREIL